MWLQLIAASDKTGSNLVGKSIASFRTMSRWGYMLAFGSMFGFATIGYQIHLSNGSVDTGELYMWVVGALIGSLLLGFKNRLIRDGRLRALFTLSDGAALLGGLVLIAVLPGYIGMVKGLVLLAMFAVYLLWYYRKLETTQLA